jgi:hypothetical protein
MPDSQLIVETDALEYAVAAILSRVCRDGKLRPIAFHSWSLQSAERNYNVHNKELLAIYEAFKTWQHYLEGAVTTIQVLTDHKNLEYFSTTKMLTRRQAQWSEYLSAFNLHITYRPGKDRVKPDTLTWRYGVYSKDGTSYAKVNPENLRPVFSAN